MSSALYLLTQASRLTIAAMRTGYCMVDFWMSKGPIVLDATNEYDGVVSLIYGPDFVGRADAMAAPVYRMVP